MVTGVFCLLKYDKMIHRFLPEVIKDIQSEFDLNV